MTDEALASSDKEESWDATSDPLWPLVCTLADIAERVTRESAKADQQVDEAGG